MIEVSLKDLLFSIMLSAMHAAHSSDMINLPEPRLESDYSIEQAIHNRRSVREFSNKPLVTGRGFTTVMVRPGE